MVIFALKEENKELQNKKTVLVCKLLLNSSINLIKMCRYYIVHIWKKATIPCKQPQLE